MATTSSVSQPDSKTPWCSDGHWKAGDKAWWIYAAADGLSRTAVEIVDPAEGTIRDPHVIYNDGVFRASDKFEHIRHRDESCIPCAASMLALLAAGEQDATLYWNQWSPASHLTFMGLRENIRWHQGITRPLGTFTAQAAVPDWLREATAARLRIPESPSLSIARICDPIDWPTLLEQHPGDLPVLVGGEWTEPHITWELLVDVFRMIETVDPTAYLDADLEVDDGSVQLLPIMVGGNGLSGHPDVAAKVSKTLGIEEFGPDEGFWLLA